MKRTYKTALIALLTLIFGISALSSSQKYYYHDSEEYKLTTLITTLAGHSGPSLVTPVSSQQLLKTLSEIDSSKLRPEIRELYQNLLAKLEKEDAVFRTSDFYGNIVTDISLEGYLNLNPGDGDDFITTNSIYEYKDRLPLFYLGLEGSWSNYVYGKFTFNFKRAHEANYTNQVFATNIPDFGSYYSLELIQPQDAAISAGNSFMNFFLGRGKLNVGGGEVSNLMISDNFRYQDFMKFSLDSQYVDYDLTYTHFDTSVGSNQHYQSWMNLDGDHQHRVSHHYSIDFAHKVRLTLSEGIMIYTESAFDLRMFNPFIFIHNWQAFSSDDMWGNNIAGLEVNANLGAGFTLNFQFVLDQFQLGSEVSAGDSSSILPNAWGVQGTLGYTTASSAGIVHAYLEGTYTTPYLYLNNLDSYASEKNNKTALEAYYNYDYIVGYYNMNEPRGGYGDVSYSGYKYGPDCVTVALGTTFTPLSVRYSIYASLMLRLHGENGIYGNDKAEGGSANLNRLSLTGTIEYMTEAKLGFSWKLVKSLKMSAMLGYRYYWNYQNTAEATHGSLQAFVGFTFTPTDFIPKAK